MIEFVEPRTEKTVTRFVERHAGALQLAFVVGVIGFALLLSTLLRPDSPEPAPAGAAKGRTVSIVAPVATPFRPSVRLNGVVQARTVTSVIPQVSGRVIKVSPAFRPGASVSLGELLFVIDRSDYKLAIERTLAEIEVARSDLARLEAEAASEREVWQQQFPDRQIPDLIARVPQIAAAKARIHSGEAARQSAELSLSRTTVRAPFDARIPSDKWLAATPRSVRCSRLRASKSPYRCLRMNAGSSARSTANAFRSSRLRPRAEPSKESSCA
jgi:multidrug efflux pump subunit AcrA (membrane-fusion protein)